MSILKFTVGRPGSAHLHLPYILRETACAGVETINLDLPHDRLTAYAATEEALELRRPQKGNGEARTQYRLMLSFAEQETPERALALAKQFVAAQFPNARAILSCHTDSDHVHVHCYMPARGTDGRKLRVGNYYQLDQLWAKAYDRAYGTSYAPAYLERKRDPNHKRPKDWEVQKAYDQRRTTRRKHALAATGRTITTATRLESIARLEALDRSVESHSSRTTESMGHGTSSPQHSIPEQRQALITGEPTSSGYPAKAHSPNGGSPRHR